MATITRNGYGQVEPNHIIAMRTGQTYNQLPAKNTITQLENGQFAKYDMANGVVDTAASVDGEYLLVMNEVKLYDERDSYKDFVVKATDAFDGKIYSRLYKTSVGDFFTTNCLEGAGSKGVDFVGTDNITVGAKLVPNANGFLAVKASPAATDMVWKVVEITTCPDAVQPAVKIQRIQ